jgi:hypothetical protein
VLGGAENEEDEGNASPDEGAKSPKKKKEKKEKKKRKRSDSGKKKVGLKKIPVDEKLVVTEKTSLKSMFYFPSRMEMQELIQKACFTKHFKLITKLSLNDLEF